MARRQYYLISTLLLCSSAAIAQEPTNEEAPTPSWFRLDSDSLGLQLWVGAVHSIGPIDIASNIYATSDTFAELDVGPTFSTGSVVRLTASPMIGIGFNWSEQRASTLVPQLLTILDSDFHYFESWAQLFMYSAFTDGADNIFYTRDFLLGKITEDFHFGVQVEATFVVNNEQDLLSLPVGGRTNVAYGENNLLGLFLGYETQESARQIPTGTFHTDPTGELVENTTERALVGRFTFIRTW
jgi:hypothetical protein